MSALLKSKVEAIRVRHAAATPGPWRWFGYAKRSRKTGGFYLATTHSGRRYVMDVVRSGFRDAQPRFQPHPQRGMLLASELAEYEVEYRDDITGIAAPDAVFMAAAWQDVADLLARVAELEAAQHAGLWQYVVRDDKGGWLADVVLRADGYFSAVSDWGGHAFRWTAPGMPFREFVAQLTPDYVASKLQGGYADGFARKVWPGLVAMVRAELDAELAKVGGSDAS